MEGENIDLNEIKTKIIDRALKELSRNQLYDFLCHFYPFEEKLFRRVMQNYKDDDFRNMIETVIDAAIKADKLQIIVDYLAPIYKSNKVCDEFLYYNNFYEHPIIISNPLI